MIDLKCKNCGHTLLKNAVIVIASIKCPSCKTINEAKTYSVTGITKDKFLGKILDRSIKE